MEKKLYDFLVSKGFEIEEKKTVIQAKFENLVGFSFFFKKAGMIVKLPLFKSEDKGSRSTHKENAQREELIKLLKKNDDYSELAFEQPSPQFGFETMDEFYSFIKRNKVIQLIKDYSEFKEVNVDFEIGETEFEGKVIKHRKNIPTEVEIVRDVFLHKEYERKGLVLEKDDVVIDMGGNIGCFCIGIFDKVKRVIVFEPEEINSAFIEENINVNNAKNITFVNKAVIGGTEKVKHFYLGKVPYYYSFLVKNNRKKVTVNCVNINDVISKYNPTKMKIDIEGSEYDVLINCKDFGRVKQIIFEYNFDMNGDLKDNFVSFDKLKKHLSKHGFNVDSMKKYSKSKSWAEVFIVYK